MKFCSKCGVQNEDDVLFCIDCGNKFDPEDVNQQQPPQDQQNQQQQPPQQQFYQQQPQQFQQPLQQQQYYQPPYQQQPMYYAPPPVPGKGMAIASLVLGICSIVYLFVLGIVGIVLAVMAKKRMTEAGYPPGIANAGLVLSIIGTAIGALLFISCIACVGVASCSIPTTYYW